MGDDTGGTAAEIARLAPFLALLIVGCPGVEALPVDAGVDVGADAGADATVVDARSCALESDCDDGLYCTGAESCVAGACTAATPPCAAADCDETTDACSCLEADLDGDGADSMTCGGTDCDDSDPDRAPGLPEVCDGAGLDEDCDPATFGFRDGDGDTYVDAACCNIDGAGRMTCGQDCDDARPGVHPAVPEVCNEIDDDCDSAIDEGLLVHVFVDADGDGHGELGTSDEMDACTVEPGWARLADDCDDGAADRFPGNPEVCDDFMVDEDCSGTGNDIPGGCGCTGTATEVCGTTGRCSGATHQCTAGRWSPCTVVPATEVCAGDGVDEDCDGMVDEGVTVTCFRDTDDDGYGPDGSAPTPQCRASAADRAAPPWDGCPTGWTGRVVGPGAVDCCDSDARAYPGAAAQTTARACGGFDFDCDGVATPTIGGARHTCGDHLFRAACEGDHTNMGWCPATPPACGETGGYNDGSCGWTSLSCRAISCVPTTRECR